MFDIGFSELVVIALVALVVLGPERLPRAARFAGLWVRRARAHWYAVKSELEQELAADELRRSLHDTQAALHDTKAALHEAGESLRDVAAEATPPQAPSGQATGADDGERRD
jgi:sec-independent protein translocase protein TatB